MKWSVGEQMFRDFNEATTCAIMTGRSIRNTETKTILTYEDGIWVATPGK